MQTWFITGCSTGLGRALAEAVLDRGWNAVVTARDTDVADLFATHVFGPVAVAKAVLPGMRARRSGTIVDISSIGAQICPAGSGCHAATKAALEGLSGSMRRELAPLGITVVAVEPGGFRTDFARCSLTQSAHPITDYAETAGKRRKEHDTAHGTQPGDPARGPRPTSPTDQLPRAVHSPHRHPGHPRQDVLTRSGFRAPAQRSSWSKTPWAIGACWAPGAKVL